ncbi:kinase-like protein [Agrocybe pediades]|nr:kinase-like protein [Agrocybe pediades]
MTTSQDFENVTVYFSEHRKASTGLPPFFWGYLLHSPCTFLGSHRTVLVETGVLEKHTRVNLYLSKANLFRHIGSERGDDMLFVTGAKSDHQCTICWDGHTANSVRLKDASGGMTYVDRVQMQKDVPYPLRDGNIISFVPRAEGDTPSPGPIISRDYVYFHVPNELPVDVRSMYVLQSRTLGAGQTAVVREGIHKLSGARYAIKTYKLYNESSGNAIKRHVTKEIRAAASFRHPGICQILEVFTAEDGRITNAVFEYFDGTDLETYLRRFPRLSELTTQHISFQLCCALSHIHSLNIVHGDIKPTNILISQDIYYPIVKICDFGTAQLATLPRAEYVGCLAYSAPESMHPKIFNQYTTVADSWSLGAVIFFMLTNEPAYFDPDADINGERRLGLPIKWNNLEAVGVGIHCKNILARMLSENPTQRISAYESLSHPWLDVRQRVLAETQAQPMPAAALQNAPTET